MSKPRQIRCVLPAEQLEYLHRKAQQQDQSISQIMRSLLAEAVKREATHGKDS